MNKVVLVLGAAAVATLAGCRDADYDAKRGVLPQDEATQVVEAEPAPAKPVEIKVIETKTVEVKPVEVKPAPAKPVDVKPAEPEVTTYIVQRGDYLAKISKKFNVTIAAIKKLNGLKGDNVRLGQKLKLPGKLEVGEQKVPEGAIAKKPAKKYVPYTGDTKEYVVKNGDTLGKIAYSNGMNIRQLKELNGLKGNSVRVGQKLKIAANAQVAETKTVAKKPAAKGDAKKADATPAPAPTPVAAPAPAPAPVAAPVEPEQVAAPANDKPAGQPAAAAAATTTYVVNEGDDMVSVSMAFGVSAAKIRELNNLGENDQLKPGQVIKLPADAQQ